MKRILTAVIALAAAVALAAPAARLDHDARGTAAQTTADAVLLGAVAGAAAAGSFTLADGTMVLVDGATTWRNVPSADQLGIGDLVRVEGVRRDAHTVAAHQVTRLLAAEPPTVIEGVVALISPPSGLVLANGARIVTGAATGWVGIAGWHELRAGDTVRVTGTPTAGAADLLAASVERLAPAAPTTVVAEDAVAFVEPPDRFGLRGGLELEAGPGTRFEGLDSVADLAVGDPIRVEARSQAGSSRLEALVVTRIAAPDGLLELLATVAEVAADRFTTSDGWQVLINARTTLTGFANLSELAPGDAVAVTGRPGDGPRTLVADGVVLGVGEGPGGGQATGGEGLELRIVGVVASVLLPDRLVLDLRDDPHPRPGDAVGRRCVRTRRPRARKRGRGHRSLHPRRPSGGRDDDAARLRGRRPDHRLRPGRQPRGSRPVPACGRRVGDDRRAHRARR